jgi:hypothetical protein
MARDGVITEKEKEKIKYALLGSNRVNRAKIGKGIVSYEQDKGLAELQNALSQLNSPSESTRGGVPSTPMVEMMRGMETKEAMSNGSSSSSMMMVTTESEDAGKKKRPRSISLKQALSSAQKDTKKYHRRKPRRWTKEEDEALRASVKKVRNISLLSYVSHTHTHTFYSTEEKTGKPLQLMYPHVHTYNAFRDGRKCYAQDSLKDSGVKRRTISYFNLFIRQICDPIGPFLPRV